MAQTPFSRKRFLSTGLVVFGGLLLFYLFPFDPSLNDTIQSIILGTLLFFALPALYVKSILRGKLSDLGFRQSGRRFGWLASILVAASALSVFFLLARFYPVADTYYLPSLSMDSFWIFAVYEVVFVGAIAFLYEVFFRGFVQIFWLAGSGLRAVFLQFALFSGFLLVTSGITWQEAPMLIAAVSSGLVAFYTRSIWCSFVSTWLVFFLSDVLMLIVG